MYIDSSIQFLKGVQMIASVSRRVFLLCLLMLLASAAHGQCNSNPIARPDTAEAAASPILLDVLANDSEPDGEALSVQVTGHTCSGSTEIVIDLIRLTPTPSIETDCTLTYRIEDESGRSSTAQVSIETRAPVFSDGFENGTSNQWAETCSGASCVEGR